ncbi:MAG: hypothetical protein AAGD00_00485 [Planctomycetota bacterium]
MTASNEHNNPVSRGAVIRAAADGEMTPEQRDAFEALADSDPQRDRRVAFEQGLRGSVARSMSGVEVPAGLRSSVLAVMRDESDGAADVVRVAGSDTRSTSFWARAAAVGAIAAAVALVGVISTNQPGPRGGGQQLAGNSAQATGAGDEFFEIDDSSAPSQNAARLVSFVAGEHDRCNMYEDHFDRKFVAQDKASAITMAVEVLPSVPSVEMLQQHISSKMDSLSSLGYEFSGLGPCMVPGTSRSVHLIYTSSDPSNGAISLFVAETEGMDSCTLKPGTCHTRTCSKAGHTLAVWKDEAAGLVFFLVVPDQETLDETAEPLSVPVNRELLT